jgi:Mrp family chromosome partitioning ATPase
MALGAVVARLTPLAERDQVRTILVTSPTVEDVAEATAIDIALALTDSGMRVSLITARPASVQSGWLPSDGRLRVTDSAALRTGGDLLNPERVRMVFAELREYSDFVLVVGAPVLRSPDSLVLADRADGVLIAVDKRQRAINVQRACDAVSEVGGVLLGVVLRGFTRPVSGPAVSTQVGPIEEPAAQASPVTTPTS